MKKKRLHRGQQEYTESIVEIDPLQLDRDWLEQPKLYFRYATELAEVKNKVAERKADLDLVRARVEMSIRSEPTRYRLAKVTDNSVSAALVADEEVIEAVEALNKAKYREDLLRAVVDALEHRKRALENIVTLHGQNYFSTPRAPKEDRERIDEMEKKASRKRARIGKPDDE